MPLMDEFKEERKALKEKSFKEKWDYFWYYYKGHVIGGLFALIVGSILIHDAVTSKDTAFYAAFLNAFATDRDESFIQDFAESTDINLEKNIVYLDTNMRFNLTGYDDDSMANAEKFLAMYSAGEIDVLVSDRDMFASYADNGIFRDLRYVLTAEQLERYKEHFFYYDQALLDRKIDMEAVIESDIYVPADETDRRSPESMQKPVPVGIFLDDTMKKRLTDIGYYADSQELVFTIMGQEKNIGYCRQFLDWLTCEE